jgi:hypothetical protein
MVAAIQSVRHFGGYFLPQLVSVAELDASPDSKYKRSVYRQLVSLYSLSFHVTLPIKDIKRMDRHGSSLDPTPTDNVKLLTPVHRNYNWCYYWSRYKFLPLGPLGPLAVGLDPSEFFTNV